MHIKQIFYNAHVLVLLAFYFRMFLFCLKINCFGKYQLALAKNTLCAVCKISFFLSFFLFTSLFSFFLFVSSYLSFSLCLSFFLTFFLLFFFLTVFLSLSLPFFLSFLSDIEVYQIASVVLFSPSVSVSCERMVVVSVVVQILMVYESFV